MNKNHIILASSSPRRIDIMHQHGIHPVIIPANVDESIPEGADMEDAVMYLALKKALFVEEKIRTEEKEQDKNSVIIAADTVVYKDRIIGKPKDRQDAFEILWSLKGKMHEVATGVCILQAGTTIRHCFCEITKVFFKDFTEEELNAYLDTPEPYDKAGAYAIQGAFAQYVDHIEGDLNNVIGFPWDRIQLEFDRILG
ncbi:Maf family protein [Aminipila luticellarii]|uniref:dTTP/UTP pyrophosphatase n=1 Tax=Aminipila luticellarii TaxID=2507160 RepID=A0A410PVT1_9FIRM|nr:Maf family protein [Aminipila luticellarii]QAT43043.1 septum formation protein Maf [Aminipila luticellarii]